jgi:isopenicillin-N epimerase
MESLRSKFQLRPDITFLNFGSFGACPKEITENYRHWQDLFESEPIQFMTVIGPHQLKLSREALGNYIGCDADDVVFTTNPSYAMNIVAKSLKLEPGDEMLTTDLEYGAMDRTWNYYARQYGYTYKRQPIRLPLQSKEDFIEQFWNGYTPKTKAIFISQITSSTALIFPVKEICKRAKELGLLTIVDGAHVPGHIALDLNEMEADIYTGACHKWMMTPKGSSFLYAKKEVQNWLDPLIISWGYESATPSHSKFLDYHQQQGTRDFSAFLTIPKALDFMRENKWTEVADSCRKLAHDNYQRFCDLLQTKPLAPITDEFLGQMCSMEIRTTQPEKLKQLLYAKYKIEIPVMVHADKVYLRYSVNAMNDQADLDKLYNAISEIGPTSL